MPGFILAAFSNSSLINVWKTECCYVEYVHVIMYTCTLYVPPPPDTHTHTHTHTHYRNLSPSQSLSLSFSYSFSLSLSPPPLSDHVYSRYDIVSLLPHIVV